MHTAHLPTVCVLVAPTRCQYLGGVGVPGTMVYPPPWTYPSPQHTPLDIPLDIPHPLDILPPTPTRPCTYPSDLPHWTYPHPSGHTHPLLVTPGDYHWKHTLPPWTDSHVWKHYLPVTSLAGDKNSSFPRCGSKISIKRWGQPCSAERYWHGGAEQHYCHPQGNVFTPVCHSVYRGEEGVCLQGEGFYLKEGRGVYIQGGLPNLPPPTGTREAGGKHSSGMLSCGEVISKDFT